MTNIFENHITDNEIIVGVEDFAEIKANYSQEFIISQLSDAIELFKIKLPYREISVNDLHNDFKELCDLEPSKLIIEGEWGAKFDYKLPLSTTFVENSRVGNESSDYFQQIQRWKCDATGYPSPQKTWENEQFRLTLFKAVFSLNVKELNPTVFRNLITLRKYIASQFRPSAAKAIYDYFNAEHVLDLSMGWGDRLAGAAASKSVKGYVGIDPNINLFNGYYEQVKYYSNFIDDNKAFSFKLGCAEDENLVIHDQYDMIFTSPPYYDKEKYDQSENQSYIKYKAFDNWMNNFLNKAISIRTPNLKVGGHLILNISDIYTRKKHYQICDLMNDHILGMGCYEYIGCWGLKMPKRPMSKSSKNIGVYGEPIWIFKKIK